MCIIDRFLREAPPGESPWTKENVMSLVRFFSHDEIPKIKICHMVAKDHPEVIEGRRRLIAVDVLESEETAEDASILHDDAAEIEAATGFGTAEGSWPDKPVADHHGHIYSHKKYFC